MPRKDLDAVVQKLLDESTECLIVEGLGKYEKYERESFYDAFREEGTVLLWIGPAL